MIDINRISAFYWEQNSKKLTFWLPDSPSPIVLHPRSDAYEKVLEYIEKKTGHSLD